MLIPRYQTKWIDKLLQPGKVLQINGSRRVGKTTLLQNWYETQTDKKSILRVNGEDFHTRQIFTNTTPQSLFQFVGLHNVIIFDAAQDIPDLSVSLSVLLREMPFIKIITSYSIESEMPDNTTSSLRGRTNHLFLQPLAQMELKEIESFIKTTDYLPLRLLYGSYPEVLALSTVSQKEEYLRDIVGNYIYKDILAYESLRKADKIMELLKLIAWQTGKEASLPELGSNLGLNKMTVESYLNLLHRFHIIYPRTGYSLNPSKEISKSKRWYFYDNGILNTVISDFRPLAMRQDIGALWENYLLSERQKRHHCLRNNVQSYFWKSYNRQELDLMEVAENARTGYNFNWKNANVKAPGSWQAFYPEAQYKTITPDNYYSWITSDSL